MYSTTPAKFTEEAFIATCNQSIQLDEVDFSKNGLRDQDYKKINEKEHLPCNTFHKKKRSSALKLLKLKVRKV